MIIDGLVHSVKSLFEQLQIPNYAGTLIFIAVATYSKINLI